MYCRISGYDYRYEIDSHVTKCSFGSFKEICEANPALQVYPGGESDGEETRQSKNPLICTKTKRSDKGSVYRRAQLLLTAFHVLTLHKLKSQNQRALQNQKTRISERHPFYIIALIKKRCGTLGQYLQAPQSLLDKQQIKLETLFKSLSIHHRRLRQSASAAKEGRFARNPARQLFEPTYAPKCKALDRLKQYATARRKKRYLNFIATQYIMLKYKRITLKHW